MAKTTKRGSEPMKSGVNIDCRYVIKVKELMDPLPRPSPKHLLLVTGWNEWLPLITIGVGI